MWGAWVRMAFLSTLAARMIFSDGTYKFTKICITTGKCIILHCDWCTQPSVWWWDGLSTCIMVLGRRWAMFSINDFWKTKCREILEDTDETWWSEQKKNDNNERVWERGKYLTICYWCHLTNHQLSLINYFLNCPLFRLNDRKTDSQTMVRLSDHLEISVINSLYKFRSTENAVVTIIKILQQLQLKNTNSQQTYVSTSKNILLTVSFMLSECSSVLPFKKRTVIILMAVCHHAHKLSNIIASLPQREQMKKYSDYN